MMVFVVSYGKLPITHESPWYTMVEFMVYPMVFVIISAKWYSKVVL